MGTEKIRESVIAGTWYPGNAQKLSKEIEGYLDQAKTPTLNGEVVALIAPHAGYMYSGGVAAYAYKLLREQPFDRVLIVAPSHRTYFEGASVYSLGGFRTPLGVVPLDHELLEQLLRQPAAINDLPEAHAQEHSLEIQLPFLQVVLKEFQLTPLVMGEQSYANCQSLATAIAAACQNKRVLLVASSDLSHYHAYQEAKTLDQFVLDAVSAYDPKALDEQLRMGKCEACGAGPIMTVMLAARELGANQAKVLHYANSGDVTGDRRGVVGYMSAVLYRNPGSARKAEVSEKPGVGVDLGLSLEEKHKLLDIARSAILHRILKRPMPSPSVNLKKLNELRAAFVCLKINGKLRGCIGCTEPRDALYKVVRDMAVEAAFCDPRFAPLSQEELEHIHLEISVLTPLERIHDPSQIEIGKHGLVIRKGFHSGLLLPQVATENHWDREQFLEWTCNKAGLSIDAWKDPETQMHIFSADVFSEGDGQN